ncbi:MAG: hypothetical protein HQ539_03435 [Parcubacteria group bacterium]|nr:hypothetical protein [Parcubacteria group bacterium]
MDKKIIVLFLVLGIILSGCQIAEEQTEEPVETGGEELNDTAETEGETGEINVTEPEEGLNETIGPEEETEDINATEPEENVLTIEIDNLTLSQKYVTIEKGTTVVWINKENNPHMLAAHYGEFRSPRLEQGDSFNHTFDEVGEYTYICAIFKTQIRGTITVE